MKKTKHLYIALTAILFILAAFSFWEMLSEICNMAGSIACADPGYALAELLRMLPLMLTACTYIHLLLRSGRLYSERHDASRCIRLIRRTGYSVIVLGAIISLYVLVGVPAGEYESFIEGYISPLFPLDILLGGLIFIALGLLLLRYAEKLGDTIAKLPFKEPSGVLKNLPEAQMRKSFLSSIFGVFGRIGRVYAVLAALCGFTACLYGFFFMDWSHGALLFNIVLWLNYFSAFAMYIVYRFGCSALQPSYRPTAAKRYGCRFLILNVLLLVLYTAIVSVRNEAPNANAFAIMPIDYFSSINAFLILYGANNILVPLSMWLWGCVGLRKKKNTK